MDVVKAKDELKKTVRERLGYGQEYTDEEVSSVIDDCIMDSPGLRLLSVGDKRRIGKEVFDSLRRLDILQSFIEDKSVTEVMINGYGNVFVEKAGALTKLERGFDSEEKLMDVIQQIVAGCNRTVNEASPIVDARLSDGSRVNIVLPPVALSGPTVTIRRFPEKPVTMEGLLNYGSVTEEVSEFLKTLVKAKYNIFISGGTGSGKTTFLNVLSGFIPSDERVITIEDSAELQLQGIENLVRLETRNGGQGAEEISIRDLIRSSLRMRPDRIIVGEVRGGEALDMLQCLNTGHDGSMSTGHANSSVDMLSRLENMVLMATELPLSAVRAQIASGLDIIVHLGRLRDRSRKVLEISEVCGYENGEISLKRLYGFFEEGYEGGRVKGFLRKTGDLENREKLVRAGLSLG
ncbi:MAG: CpaF family protein [Lachnospiraceae bacterium]|nr:CpaF family protein [Lachnospiraceae bacterium]